VLQAAFGWNSTHLYQFDIGNTAYGPLDEDDPDQRTIDDRKVRLADVVRAGQRFSYRYDFGDDWGHDIVVESVDATEVGAAYPLCTGGARACPPDDCGGPFGYLDLLEALGNPAHEAHAEMREWVGGHWDPEGFDANAVNRALREIV
jgi:hypothetical protein